MAVLVLSTVYAGSVLAEKEGVGESREVFQLSVGDGPGQIGYVEGNDDVGAWGPWSFTVLADGKVAILDGAHQRILVVSDSGEEVKSVPFGDVGLVRPVDLREWRGRLAVAEGNADPQAVVLIDMDSWNIEERIEVPDALVELGGLLEESSDGGLQLVVGSRESHLISGVSEAYDVSIIGKAQAAIDVAGVGQVAFEAGDPANGAGPIVQLERTQEKSSASRRISTSGVAASDLCVVGGTDQGHLLVRTGYWLSKGNDYEVKMYLEELLPGSLETVASVTLPCCELHVLPDRWLSVDQRGQVWCMVCAEKAVSFRILTPTAGTPDVTSGSLARSMTAVAVTVGDVLEDAFGRVLGASGANATGGNTYQTRTQARNTALSYYYLNWYCNTEAYYRSCGTPGGSGLDGNSRPVFIPSGGYNRYYQWAPYAWGHMRTASEILNYVGTTGHDAGDASGGFIGDQQCYTLPCCYGVDCSGYVQRVWGVGGTEKHNVSMLVSPAHGHATQLSDSYTGMLQMDVCAHSSSQGNHIVLFDGWAGDYSNFYELESTTEGYDRVVRRVKNWTVMKAADPAWHKYRYNYWTGS